MGHPVSRLEERVRFLFARQGISLRLAFYEKTLVDSPCPVGRIDCVGGAAALDGGEERAFRRGDELE